MTECAIEVSRGTAYGLSLSQMALALGCVLFFPAVHVQVFTPQVSVVNGTLAPEGGVTPGGLVQIALGAPLLVSAGCTLWFSALTMSLHEQNALSKAYVKESLDETGAWDVIFWFLFVLSHLLFAAMLCTPCDVYGVCLGVAILAYFSHGTCSPQAYGQSSPTQTQGNLNVLGYYAGAVVLCRNIPGTFGSARTMCLLGLVGLDCVMGLGHTWDREMSLETVTNCRLFYVCVMSLALCTLYGVWYDTLRIP